LAKKIAILQSNYIPWKGYFDLIHSVDEFVLYDDVQFTKHDWRNRNVIKTNRGTQWLTIPVQHENFGQLIKDTKTSDKRWPKKHWATLSQNYARAEYFREYRNIFEQLYLSIDQDYLSEINYRFITVINEILGINTQITWSTEFDMVKGQTERLLSICKQCGATEYVSGPAARDYFDIALAEKENINVSWMDYSEYPKYNQLHQPFVHEVTIIDLLFNMGPKAKQFMKTF
jgi:hypothetical protein